MRKKLLFRLMSASFFYGADLEAVAQDTTPTTPTLPSSAAEEGTAEAEQVIVTGSHIPTAQEVGPNPVQEISRQQIESSGDRTTGELLRRLPIVGPTGVPTANNGAGFTPGASSIALRSFDASSTLVLLDGRRLAPYPLGFFPTGGITFVDINSIPKPAIESIEILKDSASSIYGADAVAGVVNIKFRRDYRGAEITTSYGNTLDKDSGEFSSYLVFGTGDANTNVTGVLNYYHRNGIFAHDRAFSGKGTSFNASPLNLQLSRAAVLAAGVPQNEIPDSDVFFGHAPKLTQGESPPRDYIYTPGRSSFFNPNLFVQSVPDTQRYGGFANFMHKIYSDQLVLYGDVFYQNVDTRYEIAPAATQDFQTPGNITLAIPPHQPGPTLGGPSYEETAVPFGAFNPFNPFQQIISGGTRARLAEFGNRVVDSVTDAFFTTLGLKGEKLFDGNWGYDGGFRYSTVKNTSMFQGVSISRFNRILNAADPIFDPASPQYIGTTVPYNPFGDYRRPIATNFIPVNFATIFPKEVDTSTLATLDLNIYTTSLFKLPAGGVGLAIGGQFRTETLKGNPDELQLQGDVIGTGPGLLTNAGRRTYAFYAEASIPIVSEANRLPLIRSLDFNVSARFENFLNNNTNVLVPKVGMRWQPFDESLTIRATWGEGFHQPSLIELFGSPSQGINADPFGPIDPVTHMPAGEYTFITRSNPNLQPEDSRAFSGGIVYSPKFVPGLTATIDLWAIESKGRAVIPPDQNVLDRAAEGRSLPLEAVHRNAAGEIILLESAFQNSGSRKASGADFTLSYQLDTRFGTFTSITQATYLNSLELAFITGDQEMELRGNNFFDGDDSALKWRATSTLEWNWHGFDLNVTAHYLDGFHEIVNRGPQFPDHKKEHYVKQTTIFDAQASYILRFAAPVAEQQPVAGYSKDTKEAQAPSGSESVESSATRSANYSFPAWKQLLDKTTITIGCNNVFGQDPPREVSGSFSGNSYPAFLYDPTGRFVYLRVTKKF